MQTDTRKCFLTSAFFSHREVKALDGQRETVALDHCRLSVRLVRKHRGAVEFTADNKSLAGRRDLNIQRWPLGTTCGAHRLMQQSCGCWTQSFT